MGDTPTGETATPGGSKTEVTNPTTPAVNVADPAVEQLKKEAQQAQMRAQQLQNQLDEAKKAEDARVAKELEEKQEFKSLYEQEKAKREEIETQQQAEARQKELEAATSTVLADFPDAVKEIAKEAGLTVLDNSDEAKAAFKQKLEGINAKLPQTQVGANNPGNPTPSNNPLSATEMKLALKNEGDFHDLASKLPSVGVMLKKS